MKWIKKVATTPLENIAKVINSLANGSDTNAPSINAVNGAITAIYNAIDTLSNSVATALSGKQATITGAASSITTNNLTSGRALISNSNGKVGVSSVTSTELNRLSGIQSNVQEQITNNIPRRLHKNINVLVDVAGSIYSTTATFTASDGYDVNQDSKMVTVYSSSNNIRIDSVTRVDASNKVTYYILYHGTQAETAGAITINTLMIPSIYDTGDITPNA